MLVTPDHRKVTRHYGPEVYRQLAARCISELSKLAHVGSIYLCGSLIKDTLISNWSDLDIIVFTQGSACSPNQLDELREALKLALGTIQIGIGVDICPEAPFYSSLRIGGRPLAMTFEVAGYAELAHGKAILGNAKWSESFRNFIEYDRIQAIRATVHNWRRGRVGPPVDESCDQSYLAELVKIGLKLLKYEVDPQLSPPYTYQSALNKFVSGIPNKEKAELFQLCVEIRSGWGEVGADPRAISEYIARIARLLDEYAEPFFAIGAA